MKMKKLTHYVKLLEKHTGKKVRLKEAPVDYGDTGAKMEPGIEKSLKNKQTDLSDNPALPNQKGDSSYEEMMASQSFKRVVDNLKKYTGITPKPGDVMPLQRQLMGVVNNLNSVEQKHNWELSNIAISLVMKEMGIEPGEIDFEAELKPAGSIDLGDYTKELSQEEQMETEEELFDHFEELNLEVQKRRFINSLTQGAAVKAQNMHHLVKSELDAVDPRLFDMYGVLMSVNDSMYWLLPDKTIDALGEGSSTAGHMEIEPEGPNGIPMVKAVAISFPALVHELVKGVMEVYALHGQNKNQKIAGSAIKLADSLSKEKWDLRLGPAIWDTFREMFPDELFEDDKRYLEKYLMMKLYKMPPEEFNNFMNTILSKKPQAKKMMQDLLRDAVDELNAKHEEENHEGGDEDFEGEDDGEYMN